MAKKKVGFSKQKPGITDWKFILMMLGILLVGLSVFVLNQKVTYKSDAASSAALAARCQFFNYNQCRAQCSQDFPKDSHYGVDAAGKVTANENLVTRSRKTAQLLRNCQNSCNAMKRACGRIK